MQKNCSTTENEKKVTEFKNGIPFYGKIIDEKIGFGDYVGALCYAFARLKQEYSIEALADIADVYSEMGLYELSAKFWFKYLAIAPKGKAGVAYEELAINAFEMKNYPLCRYYLDKKVKEDGSIDNGELRQEIISYIAEESDKRNFYRVVYPEIAAYYEDELSEAKNAIANENFDRAIKLLEKVPKGSPTYRAAAEELSLAYFAVERIEEAINLNRELIKEYGGTLNYYCNLTSMYRFNGEKEKAEYYYSMVKGLSPEKDDKLKLAMCAVEMCDHQTAVNAFKEIIDDEFFDDRIMGTFGIALLNCGEYELGAKYLKRAYMIDPDDEITAYYARLAVSLAEGKKTGVKFPLPYNGDLPEKETEKRKIAMCEALEKGGKLKAAERKKIYEYMRWGVISGGELFRLSLMLATALNDERCYDVLADFLLIDDITAGAKQAIVFTLTACGYKKKICVAAGGVFFSFRVKRFTFNDAEDEPFITAYAAAIARLAFSGAKLERIAEKVERLRKVLKGSELLKIISTDELAAAAVCLADFLCFASDKEVCKIFGVEEEKVNKILALTEGEGRW